MFLLNGIIFVYVVFAIGSLIDHYFPFKLEGWILPGPINFVYTSYDELPEKGSPGRMYVIANTGECYFWTGDQYRLIIAGPPVWQSTISVSPI